MKHSFLLGFALFLFFSGCGTSAPDSFMEVTKQYWDIVDVNPKLSYDEAWQRVVYIITKKFELEMISKDDGYVRSAYGPSYFSEAITNSRYHVRIVTKFTPNRKKVEFKIEAQVFDGKVWVNGTDSRVAANMRKDFEFSLGVEKKKKSSSPADSLHIKTPDEEGDSSAEQH